MLQTKKFLCVLITYFLVVAMLCLFLLFFMAIVAPEIHGDSFTDQAKIGTDSSSNVSYITKILNEFILVLRIISAVIVVLGIVLSAIVFSVSLGNAQNRQMGTGAIILAIVGIIIFAQAAKLAEKLHAL